MKHSSLCTLFVCLVATVLTSCSNEIPSQKTNESQPATKSEIRGQIVPLSEIDSIRYTVSIPEDSAYIRYSRFYGELYVNGKALNTTIAVYCAIEDIYTANISLEPYQAVLRNDSVVSLIIK